MSLFGDAQLVGVFRGFSAGGLEFHADLALRYQSDFQNLPMHGQFLVVQLETPAEAVLGRITNLHAEGRLASEPGDDFALRALADGRQIPENLRSQYLKYRVGIRVLGVLRESEDGVVFVPSHRRLPHVGSHVAFLSDELLREVAGHNRSGAALGYFALGEFVYCGDSTRIEQPPWMIRKRPEVLARFDVRSLVSRRSFVFARAGFGKSNLLKLLLSDLYEATPMAPRRSGKEVPVGTLIFDPDGEYFWPDEQGRPGLCDVPSLADQLVVFTNRRAPSGFYQSFVAGEIKLDIRRLPASTVVAIAVAADRQQQQNVLKLKRLPSARWRELVDLIRSEGMQADNQAVGAILGLRAGQDDAEIGAAKSNMANIVDMLHDPSSQLLDALMEALAAGKICVIDISQMRGHRGRILGGIVLQKIFDHNQDEWIKADSRSIPVIAVIEEAQSVLHNVGRSPEDPYVVWTKEGRKYSLGSILVTQQPGSLDEELLSQGDNWFVFHLLSAGDLLGLKRANSHFSDDLLSSLLNEPIRGNGVFWSSATEMPYPIPFRPLAFEKLYEPADPRYDRPVVDTYAQRLRRQLLTLVEQSRQAVREATGSETESDADVAKAALDNLGDGDQGVEATDTYEIHAAAALARTAKDTRLLTWLASATGAPWMAVQAAIAGHLPPTLADRDDVAHELVPRFLDELYGAGGWRSEKRDKRDDPTRKVTWVIAAKQGTS